MVNDYIALQLAERLSNVNFLTKTAGLVSSTTIKGRKLPISRTVFDTNVQPVSCAPNQIHKYLIPQSAETGIAFFEEVRPARCIKERHSFDIFQGTVKLVAWLNLKKIGDVSELDLIRRITENLRESLQEQDGFLTNRIKIASFPNKGNPFNNFDLDETQRPFLNYPNYAHFSINVNYTCAIAHNCNLPKLILNPQAC